VRRFRASLWKSTKPKTRFEDSFSLFPIKLRVINRRLEIAFGEEQSNG
jgi:hypothetical protein